jgi:hypothetical protein
VQQLLSYCCKAHSSRRPLTLLPLPLPCLAVLQLGLPERIALLLSQDTSARLAYILAAVEPHLQDLVARVSVKQAIEG